MTLALPTPTQHCIGGSSQGNQAGKKNKDLQTEKGKVKLFICRHDHPCTNDGIYKKKITNEFSNIAGYKLNIQKPSLFLYSSNENQTLKFKNTTYNSISIYETLRNKCLIKDVQDLYTENHKILLGEIKENLHK